MHTLEAHVIYTIFIINCLVVLRLNRHWSAIVCMCIDLLVLRIYESRFAILNLGSQYSCLLKHM